LDDNLSPPNHVKDLCSGWHFIRTEVGIFYSGPITIIAQNFIYIRFVPYYRISSISHDMPMAEDVIFFPELEYISISIWCR